MHSEHVLVINAAHPTINETSIFSLFRTSMLIPMAYFDDCRTCIYFGGISYFDACKISWK